MQKTHCDYCQKVMELDDNPTIFPPSTVDPSIPGLQIQARWISTEAPHLRSDICLDCLIAQLLVEKRLRVAALEDSA